DLFHREGRFAIFNPQAGGSAGKISCDQVYAKTKKLGDVKSIFDITDDRLRRLGSWLQKEIAPANSRSARQPARGIAGSREPQLARRVGVQQIRIQQSLFKDDSTARGYSLAVKRGTPKPSGHSAVVHDSYVAAKDLLPQLAGKKRGMTVDRVSVHGIKDFIQQSACRLLVENNWDIRGCDVV